MPRYEYSDEIVNVIKKFLTDDDWHYSFNEDTGIFRFGLKIRSKLQNISYVIDVHNQEFIVYGICPICVDWMDAEMMVQMAEFICRANYGLKNGCFELDFRDGEIRFRSYVDCENHLPSDAVVKNSIYSTAATIKRYAPGIVDIIFGGSLAKDAIAKCEKSKEEELHSAEVELRSVLEEALGGDTSEEVVGAFLSRLASKHGITEEHYDSCEDEDRPEGIRLNPFAGESGVNLDQPHIMMDRFAEEGGET